MIDYKKKLNKIIEDNTDWSSVSTEKDRRVVYNNLILEVFKLLDKIVQDAKEEDRYRIAQLRHDKEELKKELLVFDTKYKQLKQDYEELLIKLGHGIVIKLKQ
jgi:hypothetical protein